MRKHKKFWDKNAGCYDRFMRKDRAAYDERNTCASCGKTAGRCGKALF